MINYDIALALILAWVILTIILIIIAIAGKWALNKAVTLDLILMGIMLLLLTFWAKITTVKNGITATILAVMFAAWKVKVHDEYLNRTRRFLGLDELYKKNGGTDEILFPKLPIRPGWMNILVIIYLFYILTTSNWVGILVGAIIVISAMIYVKKKSKKANYDEPKEL